jgi:hypothetical protein
MAPQMEPKTVGGLSEHNAADYHSRKRKRKTKDDEEAACILDNLRSGERVLYLQEVPKVKVSHCRAWNCMPRRRTHEPIIRSYYRFALKGGTTLYGGGIGVRSNVGWCNADLCITQNVLSTTI